MSLDAIAARAPLWLTVSRQRGHAASCLGPLSLQGRLLGTCCPHFQLYDQPRQQVSPDSAATHRFFTRSGVDLGHMIRVGADTLGSIALHRLATFVRQLPNHCCVRYAQGTDAWASARVMPYLGTVLMLLQKLTDLRDPGKPVTAYIMCSDVCKVAYLQQPYVAVICLE